MAVSKGLLVLATALSCLVVQEVQSLSLYWISPREGSIAGGTIVQVYGSGFATDQYTGQNLVFLDDVPCIVQGYTVSSTRLTCITLPYPGAYEGVTSHRHKSRIFTKGIQVQSTSYYARFRYNWNYTPQVRDVLPRSGPVNSFIEVGGYRFSTDISNRYTNIYLGNQICDFWNEETNSVYGGRWADGLYYITCRVVEQIPGAWNASAFLTSWSGKTWNHSQAMKLDHDGKLSMFELYPDIHTVQPQLGGYLGGTLLRITGTGFGIDRPDMKLTVDIDGTSCEVVEHTPKEILCWTTKPSSTSNNDAEQGYRYLGSRGVSFHYFSDLNSANVDHLYNLDKFPKYPDKVAVLQSFSPEDIYSFDNYGARYMAFFTPVQSGNHTFIIKSDDTSVLYLQKGNNISDLTEIARAYTYSGWSSNTAVYSSIRSDPIELEEGEQYLLVGDMAEGSGGDFIRVGVLMHETNFLNNETTQSVRERQLIEFESHGHYDMQCVHIELNVSSVNESSPPQFELQWGSRSSIITLEELTSNKDIIAEAAYDLLKGICSFQPSFGVYYFNNQAYDFETDPNIFKETSYCGLQSVSVVSETIIIDPWNSEEGFPSFNYPFLCMAYKIPSHVQADVIIHINEIGWRSISLTSGAMEHQHVFLADWSNGEYANDIIANNIWRYGCTNIHSLLTYIDSDALQYTINGLGYQLLGGSTDDDIFFIDTVSFTSAPLAIEAYLSPSKPNGFSIDQLINTTSWELTDNDTILDIQVTLEVVPTSCDHNIPLMSLTAANDDDESILEFGIVRLQSASESIQGTYQLGIDGAWTDPIDYFSDATYIRDALNALPYISGSVDVWYRSETLPQDKLGEYCPGRKLVVRFDTKPGDHPLLLMNSNNLTGHGLEVNVREIETGGLYLYPIPGHMLQTVETTPQVHVKINNQLAACNGGLQPYEYSSTYTNPCGFSFNESFTATVDSISPTAASNGDTVTIEGTGFSSVASDNFILFGEIECNVTDAISTTITCTLGEGQTGVKELWLHVLTDSVAQTNGITLEYKISLSSVEPITSGTGGGIELTIMGDGFMSVNEEIVKSDSIGYTYSGYESVLNDNCNNWKNKVLVGDNECEITSFSQTLLKCVIPPGSAGTVNVTVTVYCEDVGSDESNSVVFDNQFTYDSGLDPTITAIVPSFGSGRGGETVTITGTGFPTSTDDITVMIGDSFCTVSSVTNGDTLECVTSPHRDGSVDVTVTVSSAGNAVGGIMYDYQLDVTGVSKCTGSLLGGHLLVITGNGFGTSNDGVDISIDSVSCSIKTITESEITCITGSTASTHEITNNAHNTDYGLGYAWDKPQINITVGDSIEWKWTGSAFTPLKRLVEVDSASANEYNGYGFVSEKLVTGSYVQSFSSPGEHYYIMEGYGSIGFRGSINVQPLSDLNNNLSLIFNSVEVSYSLDICGQSLTDGEPPSYSHLVSDTPVIHSVSPTSAKPGSGILIIVTGIISLAEYNILTIGGKPCTVSTHTSTTATEPVTELPDEGTYNYADTNTVISCTVPDVYPGDYRIVLHVTGRGWAYGEINNTIVSVEASIDSDYSTVSGSLGGGTLVTIPVTGLDQYLIGHTNVYIGNTPCAVQDIIDVSSNPLKSEIVCETLSPINDGYSSLVSGNALSYWSLQYDFYDSSNIKYSTESTQSFASSGKLSIDAPAIITGTVLQGQAGISGQLYRDQSAYFSSSYLKIEGFKQYHALDSFSFELWFKSPSSPSDKHTVLASSYQSIESNDEFAKGFIVTINPCDEIEYWLATGEHIDDDSIIDQNLYDNTSNYTSDCKDGLVVQELNIDYTFQLPVGVWRVLRSPSTINIDEWNHLVFGFNAIDKNDQQTPTQGIQTMFVNNDKTEATIPYLHTNVSDIFIGGSDILHTQTISIDSDQSQLYPFKGYIDEISLFDYMLIEQEVNTHYHYGTTINEQPIWINTEHIDGVGTGMTPNADIPTFETAIDEVIVDIDLENIVDHQSYSIVKQKGIRVKWTYELHGLYQVPLASYDSCLQVDVEKVWSPAQLGGSLIIWLETGKTYYFIDPVGDNCIKGTKFEVNIGDVAVIDWKIGDHEDVTIGKDGGIVFKWNDVIPHNVIEMSTAESVSELCTFVGGSANNLGKVVNEWHSTPSTSGEVVINGLSVGKHYFVCSVGTHCKLGMRLTVNVEEEQDTVITKESNEHIIPWYIPTTPYQTLSILEGEDITFGWNAFHSLYQVTKEVYESCDTSADPLYEWGRPSVDNSATISSLVPGSYYFICSVSGHCDAGMKLQVDVFARELAPLVNPITADCNTESTLCSFSYSDSVTPKLLSIEPSSFKSGDDVTIKVSNYSFAANGIGDELYGATVLFGNHPCENVTLVDVTESYDEITCTASNQEAGLYQVHVHIKSIGYTRPVNSLSLNDDINNAFTVSVMATATDITPSDGSIEGGTRLTITGTGFSHLADRMNVDIGGHTCDVVETSESSVVCITSSLQYSQPGSLPIAMTVSNNIVITTLSFSYSQDSTPMVTILSKTSELVGGDELTITGDKFIPNLSFINVQILNTEESFYYNNQPSHVTCVVSIVTETSIECTVPTRAAGAYSVFVHVKGKGLSQEVTDGSSALTYKLAVDQVSPIECGHGGGLELTVTGSGFPINSGDRDVEIKVCDSLCQVTEVVSQSILLCIVDPSGITDVSVDKNCDVVATLNSLTASVSGGFTFRSSLTPLVTSMSPDSGGTAGGTHVTIQGDGLLPVGIDGANLAQEDLVITIDGAICEWYNQQSFPLPTDSSVTCRTSDHRTTIFATIKVFVKGKGNAIVPDGLTYQYVDRWSSIYTWGGQEPPLEGESVYIKEGQTVFLDTDTPVLNLILIEGALIFEDEQDMHLQAKYIFINNGKLQIGTEDNPFSHNAIITLHGNVRDPEIPIYGAKVIGIRQGELDIHGNRRNVTWTRLSSTALKNASQLELQESVDWVAGDNIVIAPTGKEGNETETHVVSSVSDDGLTVYLEDNLSYTHHGITDTYENGASIDIRAEVGLLSHNVIIQGAIEKDGEFDGTGADQYGMQIMIHRTGPHPTPIRIENAEVRYAGQAFRLGRYAIHFHLSGNMSNSYIKNCAIHHSNNRALTAHGVHNLLIEGNVAYDIKGHAFFVEDGIETNNRYIHNFGIYIRSSSSLLNTDQIPAVFWITNPNNIFIDNAAVASRAYGFWYDLDNSPVGPSYTSSVCPNKEIFGQFSDNVAHSCNEFGLRIWETYTPFADGCSATQTSEAVLYNFTTYSNDIHGLEFSVVGNVKIIGFRVADNRDSGIEIQETIGDWEEATIEDTVIISHSSVNDGEPGAGGIRTPNTRGLKVSNVTFVNFNFPTTVCLRACSHCKVFQGGWQVSLEKLTFLGNSSLHKTAFQWEHEVLFHDLDGSLSGEVGGWVTPDSGLHPLQHCTKSVPEFSVNNNVPGTVCTADVYLLRMAWNNARPLVTFQGVSVNVTNVFGTSIVPWRHYRLTHLDGYMLTLPSTYDHSFIWQLPIEHEIDTSSYSAGLYSLRPDDFVIITHEFVQVPDHVNIGGNHEPQDSMLDSLDPNLSWFMDNTTDMVSYIISGLNSSMAMLDREWSYSYEPCPVEGCPQPPDPNNQPVEENQRRWSDPTSWPSGQLPVEGEDVTILSTWRMLLDISPPPLGLVLIDGELQFEDARDYNFTANIILIRGPNSHLIIGQEGSPFSYTATITLTGSRYDQPLFLSSTVRLGSKAIGIFGNVTMIGQPKTHSWTRLKNSANAGDTVIFLNDNANWSVGNEIIISSSSYEPSEAEVRTIISYDSTMGTVTINEPLEYSHYVHQFVSDDEIDNLINNSLDQWWGSGVEDLTLSPEVGLLSHNIIIQGGEDPEEPQEEHHYGCRILIGEYTTSLQYTYTGTVAIDSIEVKYCGQGGYFSPLDPRYSIAIKDIVNSDSYITRSSIHHGYNTGIGIHASSGVIVSDNVVYRTTGSSIICGGSDNVVLGNLALLTSTVQPNSPLDNHAVDFPATFDINRENIVRDNAAGGSRRISYRYSGEECHSNREPVTGDMAQFWNNTAHSGLIALVILGLPTDCSSVGGLTASHHWDYSVFSSSSCSLSITHMKLAIGKIGLNLNIFGPDPVAHLLGKKSIKVVNSLLVGFIPQASCESSKPANAISGVSLANGDPSVGIMMSSFNKKRSKMDGTGKWHLMKGYPTVDGEATATNITFAHFTPPVNCTYTSTLISNNPISPDAVHPLELEGVVKLDVPQNNLVYFYDPDPNWIVQEDCVDMDCDGPKHALIRDADGSFGGLSQIAGSIVPFAELRFSNYSSDRIPLTWLDYEGSISEPESVVDFRGVYRGNPYLLNPDKSCVWMENWNAYHCHGLDHLMLVIESMDGDSESRRISPLALVGSGIWEYTDLLNGPMDHGWCTYYTCLKRLSTFFSIVSTDIDYNLWMTGSLPGSIRLHLLNSDDSQAVRVNIWYKDPKRKDVYKNGVFVEAANTKFLDGGAVTQLDGDYTPSFNSYSGANYFEKEKQMLTILVKGSVPIEIRTPPIVQISLNVSATVEDYFITSLINNLAFTLKIDISRIRVVNIVAEDSVTSRRRRAISSNTVTIEFGDPPEVNVDPPAVSTSEQDWIENDGENDNVDMEDPSSSSSQSSVVTNPFNEEPPENEQEFATDYNEQATSFNNDLQEYEEQVTKVNEVNQLADSVVELAQIGGLQEFFVNSVDVLPAVAPAAPNPPVVPPQYNNITSSNNVTLVVVNNDTTTVNQPGSDQDGSTDPMEFTIPSNLVVSMEPSPNTGHLVYVAVSMLDVNGDLVKSLGFLNPWVCTAMLITLDGSNSNPKLEGEIVVSFEEGVAIFTRLRVDKPSSNLTLSFVTNPGSFKVNTSVSFSVHEPPADTLRRETVLILIGDASLLSSFHHDDILNDIRSSLSQTLDVDLSRIQGLEYVILNSERVQITFNLLDSVTTDPPNVPSLNDSIAKLQNYVEHNNLTISINGSNFKGLNGTVEITIPTIPTPAVISPIVIIVSIAAVSSSIVLLMFAIAFIVYCCQGRKNGKQKEQDTSSSIDYDGVGTDINADGVSEDGFRLLQIPRASIANPTPRVFHHPHSLDPWVETAETSLGSTESMDDEELWESILSPSNPALWSFPTPRDMPRIPRPFAGMPSSSQQRQSRTLASLSNHN